MYKPVAKLIVIIMMITALVGQAAANHFILTFEPASDTPLVTEHFEQAHLNTADIDDDCCDTDCCENECICPINTCTSVMYVFTEIHSTYFDKFYYAGFTDNVSLVRAFPSTIYRPPITAS